MKICVVHPAATNESAAKLAKAVNGVTWNPYKNYHPRQVFDLYFNYGVSDEPFLKELPKVRLINHPDSVRISTNKIKTYNAFRFGGVPTCEFVTNDIDVPKSWKEVVCREVVNGRNCEGILITGQDNIVKGNPLYTRFFKHTEEHRVVVYKGDIVARYMKTNLEGGMYDLQLMEPDGYEEVDHISIEAARAVGLDYAGVDILHDGSSGKSICLEINSGPLLTDEAYEFFQQHFNVR